MELLLGHEDVVMTPREAKIKMMQRTYSEELLDSVEYNSTKYLGDLDRIREVALASWNRSKLLLCKTILVSFIGECKSLEKITKKNYYVIKIAEICLWMGMEQTKLKPV